MLSTPMTVASTYMFSPYERQYVYTLVSQILMQSASSILCNQLTSKNSSYNREGSMDAVGLPMQEVMGGKTNIE